MLRLKLGATIVNDPAAVTLSVKPAISEATASPEVTAISASIWASSIAGGPDRSVLQAAAPSASIIAAALSIEFLNLIKRCAPLCGLPRWGDCYEHEGGAQKKRVFSLLPGTRFGPRSGRSTVAPSAPAAVRLRPRTRWALLLCRMLSGVLARHPRVGGDR